MCVCVLCCCLKSFQKQLKEVQDELMLTRNGRVRLEQNKEKSRKNLHIAQSTDAASEQVKCRLYYLTYMWMKCFMKNVLRRGTGLNRK